MSRFLKSTLIFLFFGLCACTALALLQIEHWFLQLFCHFLFQYTWLFGLLGISFLIFKQKVFGILSILFAIILFSKILPSDPTNNHMAAENAELSVLSINLLSSNIDSAKVNQLIIEKDADILLLIEYTSFWERSASVTQYPYSIAEVRDDTFGIALYSKYPFRNEASIDFSNSRFPIASAQIELGDQRLNILGIHYQNPIGRRETAAQKIQIQETIADAKTKEKLLVIGDFNLTPYAKDFSRLLREASLTDTRDGFGIHGSWPAIWTAFRIPIDHALVSKNIKVNVREVGPLVGSDHLPLYLEIQL